MNDINEQIKYLAKRLTELIALCEKDTTPEVSTDVRNIGQDIITRTNRLLDNILFDFFEKKIKPKLSKDRAESYEKHVQFPVCTQNSDLTEQLGRFGALDLQNSNPSAFSIIESAQPYHSKNEWLSQLRKYSNLGHRKLIAQRKKRDISLTLGDVIKISGGASVTMNNVAINGVPIRHLTVDKGTINGDLDPRLNPRVEIQVRYLLEDSNVDLLLLCEKSLKKVEEISEGFQKVL